MRFYTWCNVIGHPKIDVLNKSASKYGIKIGILGQGVVWKRNYQKIGMLYREIQKLEGNEIILCTDAFDVLYLETENDIVKKFQEMVGKPVEWGNKIVFSGEKLYSHHYPKYRKYWDKVKSPFGYRYLNSGSFIGYQRDIVRMLDWIIEDSKDYKDSSDQKLFAKYEVKNPGSIILDGRCKLFWCLGGEQRGFRNLYQVTTVGDQKKLKNLNTSSYPSVIHIPSSKNFYNLILGIAYRMDFIDKEEYNHYSKLHKDEVIAHQKKKLRERQKKQGHALPKNTRKKLKN